MKPYRILVTGSRDWADWPVLNEALETQNILAIPRPVTVIQGGASGADTMARVWGMRKFGVTVETYRADWRPQGIYNPQAGLLRNRQMVEAGADICLGFIRNGSRGATHCANLAEEAGIPTRRYEVTG